MDENYLNYLFFQQFYDKETYSMSEAFLSKMPENFAFGATAGIKTMMNTKVWGNIFKHLKDKYPSAKPVDFKCGMAKDYL